MGIQQILLFNHLKKNSIELEVGEYVEVGDYLGLIGNSGSTSEPHLHMHHQRQNPLDSIHPVVAEGLPLYFYMDNESSMPSKGAIIKGKTVK